MHMFDPVYDNHIFYRKAKWQLKTPLWPRRCELSNKWLWLKKAYEGVAAWTGPGDPVYEYRWHSQDEHLIWIIKNA